MKRIIAFTFFLLFLAAFAFISLDGVKRRATQAAAEAGGGPLTLTGTNWVLADTGLAEIEHDVGVFVHFRDDKSLHGHAGCNNFFGSWEQDGKTLQIGQMGATRMMCPEPLMDIEMTFMNALQNTRHYEIDGDNLMLTDEQGRTMTLKGIVAAENPE